jgi:hypothetical protein
MDIWFPNDVNYMFNKLKHTSVEKCTNNLPSHSPHPYFSGLKSTSISLEILQQWNPNLHPLF